MDVVSTDDLLIRLILFGLLPLWGITGFIDWCCHRTTRIETTSGLKESLIHSAMGIQLGIPIVLCIVFYVNVTILLICMAAWLLHEFIAHWDVHYSAPKRHISIWEVHVHNYMATIPLYLLMLIVVVNWEMFVNSITFNWAGNMGFHLIENPHGSPIYLKAYLTFMAITCGLPYIEENIRCLRVHLRAKREFA
ncbi:MAG: diguanylate cyclase [Gammaproteobacteria bacterium]|nr:diguanylate cyclase [Gammaproteobacteria bacterium]